jgi:hypothetical protein
MRGAPRFGGKGAQHERAERMWRWWWRGGEPRRPRGRRAWQATKWCQGGRQSAQTIPAVTLVRQRRHTDCGVAALAMVAGCSYPAARRAAGRRHGMAVGRLLVLLERLTGRRWRARKPQARSAWPPLGIVLLFPWGARVGHYVVVSRARVYDPSYRRVWRWRTYPRRTWRCRAILMPG